MKHKFLNQTRHEYSPRARIIAFIFEGIFFLGVLPGVVAYFSRFLDRLYKLPSLDFGLVNTLVGSGLIITGILLAWWTIYVQFTVGRGTPVPLMATQQLILQKPYSYCRNPMALGTIVAGIGFAFVLGSLSAFILVVMLTILLLLYIKLAEEKEMELRFGEFYLNYKRTTPFIIPRLRQGH